LGEKTNYLLIILILLSVNNYSQSNPDDIFNLLNLSYPGLEKVKEAVNRNDLSSAQEELLIYFQNRTNRKSELNEQKFTTDLPKAEMNSKNIFDIKTIKYDFGSNIDWTKVQKDKEWQFSFSRMKWFKNYVAAYRETKDEKYVKALMVQFESWNKLGDPGYPRTIDTGRRMDNLTESYWMFVQVLKAESVTPEFNALILTSMAEQAEYLYNPEHWRRYSNWGSFENSGFAVFAILFPEFQRNNEWLRELFFRMRTQLQNSYYNDGMHVETSPSYHSHELKVWFHFIKLIELNNIEDPWSPQVRCLSYKEMIVPKALALMQFYKPTGFYVQVSDTDRRDERDLLYEIGEYFNVPELKYCATNGGEGTSPKYKSAIFPEGGYSILRSGWGEDKLKFKDELYLLFDFGNNKPWHAHYDIFNIAAAAYGYDLLVDPGRFTYNNGEEREAFKSTSYHNTVEVDSKNQLTYYKAPVIKNYFFNDFDYLQGVQYSYPEVGHSRSLFFANKEYWIIIDRLNSESNHTYKQNWHLTSESFGKVRIDNNGNTVTAPHMLMFFPGNSAISLRKGFQSYQYRKKIEIPVVENSIVNKNRAVLPIVIYPFDKDAPNLSVENNIVGDNRNQIMLTIKGENYTDIYLENKDKEFKSDNLETDAKLVFIRGNTNEEITQILLIDGSFLNYKNKVLLSIAGTNANVAIANGTINVYGDCITDFTINIHNIEDAYINHKKISVYKNDGKMSYHLDKRLH